MGAWLHHWLWDDFYSPVWPNIAAAGLMAGVTIKRVKVHLHRHHAEIRKLVGRDGD